MNEHLKHRQADHEPSEADSPFLAVLDGGARRTEELDRLLADGIRDAQQRLQAQREIRSLAAFAQFNPSPAFEFASDGTLSYSNAAALALAHSLQQAHPCHVLPEDSAAIVKMCLATGQNRLNVQTTLSQRTFSWSFIPILDCQTVHCYAEEVTESLQLKLQLRQVHKMESVGQLAAGLAHDFNNVLTIIQGHAGLMLSDSGLDSLLGESAKQILLAAERASNMTRQLLLFSRKQTMQPQLLDLNDLISNISKMLRSLLGEPVSLRRNTVPDLPSIYADPGMIEQVLVNLAVNARDAMPKGGTLTLSTFVADLDDDHVRAKPEARKGCFVGLAVSDSGYGMDASTLPRIFEPFFTTKEVGKGTGLGLSTVYAIVRQHQGWIEVESQVGQGTTFTIYLPPSSKAHAERGANLPERAAGGDETILLVEDDLALRELVRDVLRKRGYTVLEAASGVQALRLWRTERDRIDLLLTDMMLPEGISGGELAQNVLAEKPAVKVIYSSGYSLDSLGSDSILLEESNYLQKPYDPDTLARAVRSRLDG